MENLDFLLSIAQRLSVVAVLLGVLWALFKGYFVLGREYLDLKSDLAASQKQVDFLGRRIDELERMLTADRTKLQDAESKAAALERDNTTLRGQLTSLAIEKNALEMKLAQRPAPQV